MFNFKNKIYLAPMDKINTIDFRNECRKNGADVAETGLISCRAIINNTEK
jgi:tRNA-dihydrouridine synthase